ncbi:MAG: RluA family pseudouridine synthase [Deltaproteobacteria bacterium]|nr:RluA family pseudouridine synthase [Deltaproteobacteria bacterium]
MQALVDPEPPSFRPDERDILEIRRFIADEEDRGSRLDRFLEAQEPCPTRSQIKKLVEEGLARVNGALVKAGHRLKAGDEIELRVPVPRPLDAAPEDIPLDVRFEDDALLVIDKPQGMVVHPAPGHPSGTLVNAVLFGRVAAGGDPLRPGIVHRLDKDTSGLLVVAKREDVHAHLARQFHDHTVDRRYLAIVSGAPPESGEWRTLHARHPGDRLRFTSRVARGRPALSRFRVVERFEGAALLEVTLLTGRTHQVRVHCHDHGFPVLGDRVYGSRHLPPALRLVHEALPGQALHARILGFTHPATGARLIFESEPHEPFRKALDTLRLSK